MVVLKIYKHVSDNSCLIVSAVSMDMAEQFISHKLDLCGRENEELNIHEVEKATTQSYLIHIDVKGLE